MGDLGYNTAPTNLNGTGLLATKGNVTYLRRVAIQRLHRGFNSARASRFAPAW
jgi:hypothetical protein